MRPKIIFNEQETQEIIDLYNDNWSCVKIGKKFNCGKTIINNLLKNQDITIKSNISYIRKYNVNENIFENIDTPEKAYWLGMLCGDGFIDNERIVLGLQVRDTQHLVKFKTFLNAEHKIFQTISRKNNKEYQTSLISIYSKKLCSDLAKLIPTNNKTENLTFPIISPQFHNSFILGMIDADGCFKIPIKDKFNKNNGKMLSKQGRVSLSSTLPFILKYEEIISNNCNLKPNKILQSNQTKFLYALDYGGNKQFLKIIKYLYTNATVYLERKRIKALSHLIKIYPNDEWILENF